MANPTLERPETQEIIYKLKLTPHIEGGYSSEAALSRPEYGQIQGDVAKSSPRSSESTDGRSLSTTVLYLLTPLAPIAAFHQNQRQTIHTLHSGKGICVVLNDATGSGNPDNTHLESFTVGHDNNRGERLQWFVGGGSYSALFLLPDQTEQDDTRLLISETIIPGFEYKNYEFLRAQDLREKVDEDVFESTRWLLRENFTRGLDFP
ncbi:hypothetical protein BBP40_009991 [Aspergillus hancockii]|nr:hypothetical protein BBP40_009991 [Aspergillus hancockii]